MTSLSAYIDGQPKRPMREWASDFGVSRPYLLQLMRGDRKPSVEVALRIAQVTGGRVPVTDWPNIRAVFDAVEHHGPPSDCSTEPPASAENIGEANNSRKGAAS